MDGSEAIKYKHWIDVVMLWLGSGFGTGTFVPTSLHVESFVQFAVQLLMFMTVTPLYVGCCFIDIANGTSGFFRNIWQRIKHGITVKRRRPRMRRLLRKRTYNRLRKKTDVKRLLFRRRFWHFLVVTSLLFAQSSLANADNRTRKSTQLCYGF